MTENQPETETAPRLCISLAEWTELCMLRKKSGRTNKSDEFIRSWAKASFCLVEHLSVEMAEKATSYSLEKVEEPLTLELLQRLVAQHLELKTRKLRPQYEYGI